MVGLEHRVYNSLKTVPIQGAHCFLAVSGGVDSLCLLLVFHALQKICALRVSVIHVHHGALEGAQGEYRDLAWEQVERKCKKYQFEFHSNLREIRKGASPMDSEKSYQWNWNESSTQESEEGLRNFRYSFFKHILEGESKGDISPQLHEENRFLVLAHNKNDLLETQLLRLIRGTGHEGLKSMTLHQGSILRPLLSLQREEIVKYTMERKESWVEDPSNEETDKFRNWMRKVWLPQLEQYQPGSLRSFARSLSLLHGGGEGKGSEELMAELIDLSQGIRNPEFLELDLDQKKRVLAGYMRTMGMRNYGLSHVEEVLKRMKSVKAQLEFDLLKHRWKISKEWILAVPKIESPQS